MASAAVQQLAQGHSTTFEPLHAKTEVATSVPKSKEVHDVPTKLNYYKDPGDGSEPAPSYVGKPETYEHPHEPLDVVVEDIRGREDQFTLDKNGFQIYRHASKEKEFTDDDQVKSVYYPETEQLLKDATGASRIFIFDHTIRGAPSDVRTGTPTSATVTLRGPVNLVHIDQSYSAAKGRVPFHLPEDADALLKTRYQIINVWRPIKQIFKDPLTVAEAHSVPESDLLPRGLIYPDRRGETLTVRPNKGHKWRYLHGQTPEEVLLIKCFDSKVDGRARRVPHTAFVNEEYKDADTRESIEIRALVFHEDQDAE
uniref:Methyltransferase n=1 Tax=Cladonia uncialis subsp. uncialis TaxID=180999 RepID=A0A1Z1CCC0_CLAUC|nr:hypothetical protein [Cladonia uncialis subsp. uncialis]AUW31030.1 hypothetical protein [Cladonia uncialis subsp. uncialis]